MSTLIYDLTTGQWADWDSLDRGSWRAHIGQNWVGMSALSIARFRTDIVAGDDETGVLWILDPAVGVDDDVDDGVVEFTRMVVGGVPLDGREVSQCNAVTLNLSVGVPSLVGAEITLRTSDDNGHTYVNHGSVVTSASNFSQVVEWRSLGLMRRPGRLFEISDNGAAVRISCADMR